jgi:ABC-type bacteriocin/lantibiotic exporter with double-glycine peptidase domain
MLIGGIFIIAGILIAIYPKLLSIIVASILIFIGIFFISIGYYYRRISRTFDNPFIDFFFRL